MVGFFLLSFLFVNYFLFLFMVFCSLNFISCIIFCYYFICVFAYFGLFLVFCVFEFVVFCAFFLPFCYLNVLLRIFHSVFNFLLFALHCFVWIIFWFVSLSASLFVHIHLSAH